MISQIKVNDIVVDVTRKKIKNIHLRVYSPHGQVKVSAPLQCRSEVISAFVMRKFDWIKRQQDKMRVQKSECLRDDTNDASYDVWGQRYVLTIIEIEKDAPPSIALTHKAIVPHIRPTMPAEKRQVLMEAWYSEQLKNAIPPLIEKWQVIMNVKVANFFVQKMKTRWGSCNYVAKTIRLNTELAKKPPACLEYVLVHELVHLLEPTHNRRFYALMDQFMPRWKLHKQELNRLPIYYL